MTSKPFPHIKTSGRNCQQKLRNSTDQERDGHTNSQTNKNSTFLAPAACEVRAPSTRHCGRGPRAHSCTSKMFSDPMYSFATMGCRIFGGILTLLTINPNNSGKLEQITPNFNIFWLWSCPQAPIISPFHSFLQFLWFFHYNGTTLTRLIPLLHRRTKTNADHIVQPTWHDAPTKGIAPHVIVSKNSMYHWPTNGSFAVTYYF